ncbi:MAG: hypothetical protein IPK17_38380 [Chloroflexi bacterium]|uniref:hypothetical protein n=1 Tax=Candidatus Flexifilum breve TaxID=3140694 RepID=UPI003136ED4C|nr:hypothetical protein [Chloroflexota bacterium]
MKPRRVITIGLLLFFVGLAALPMLSELLTTRQQYEDRVRVATTADEVAYTVDAKLLTLTVTSLAANDDARRQEALPVLRRIPNSNAFPIETVAVIFMRNGSVAKRMSVAYSDLQAFRSGRISEADFLTRLE